MKLAVNVDHVATIRQARRTDEPDPVTAALIVEQSGAHGLVMHLRQDRRHIQLRDVELALKLIRIPVNLEMAATPEMIEIARSLVPHTVTLVPENPEEVTTEGGLNLSGNPDLYRKTVLDLRNRITEISMFIDPDPRQIRLSKDIGADSIEFHTGEYAAASDDQTRAGQLDRIRECAQLARQLGIGVRAGHGLTYLNVQPLTRIQEISEFSIGHSIVAQSVWIGLSHAVRKMLNLVCSRGESW
ncbi:pyridoxine 5'-phosphate synthase [bacterium]|nr:pyridoxine 5'-phosphate synthase [candidate division CSSED10-310 bacterium]